MGGGRKTETVMASEALPKAGDPSSNYAGFRARNLRKSDLGGVIFGCKHSTISECLKKQLFGLPGAHFCYVGKIEPGLPLFLFNYSDRMLHGVYEAASKGKLNINPYAWTEDGSERTPFPAQVNICIKTYCQPIHEVQFESIISDNYFMGKHFYFELDHKQVKLLKSLFKPTHENLNIHLPDFCGPSRSLKNPSPVLPRDEDKLTSLSMTWKDVVKIGSQSAGVVSENRYASLYDDEDNQSVRISKTSSSNSENGNDQENQEPVSDWEELAVENNLVDPSNAILPDENQGLISAEHVLREEEESNSLKDRAWLKLQKIAIEHGSSGPFSSSYTNDQQARYVPEVSTELNTQLAIIPVANITPSNCSQEKVEAPVQMMKTSDTLREVLIPFERKQFELEKKVEQLKNEVEDSHKLIHQLKERIKELEIKLDPSRVLIEEPLNESLVERILGSEKLIYLLGGYNGCSWLRSLDSYSPSLDVLTPLRPMSTPRSYAAAAALDGYLFVFGGGSDNVWYNTVECYNPRNDEWSSCPTLAREKGCLAGATLNGTIFAIGGGNGRSSFSDVEMFDPVLGKWIGSQSMLTKRFATAAAVLNGSLYAVGGFDGYDYLSSVERFDPREVSWSPVPSMKSKRGSHSLVVFKDKLYALGGYDGDRMVSSVEVFDPRLGTWAMGEQMNMIRGYASPAVLGDSLFMLGGIKDSESLVDVVECYREGAGWNATSLKAVGARCFFSAIVL